jgi:hypothetical protein
MIQRGILTESTPSTLGEPSRALVVGSPMHRWVSIF